MASRDLWNMALEVCEAAGELPLDLLLCFPHLTNSPVFSSLKSE